LAVRLAALAIFSGIVVFNHFTNEELAPLTFKVLGLLAAWAAVSWLCQWGLRRPGWGEWAAYAWSAADVLMLTGVQLVTQSGVSPVIIGYPFLVAAAGLWTKTRMVWVTTTFAVIGYAGLMAYDYSFEKHQAAHRHLVFLVSLIVLGFLMSYQVQRVHALSRYYEGQPRR
jgi:eukaryotic-like serine/threonine-protein kinase